MIKIIGSDGSSSQTITDNSGRYTFDNNIIKENISYDLTVSSEGYLSTNFSQSTIGIKESVNLVQDISLEATFEEIILPKIEYDYNSADLRIKSKEALDAFIVVLIAKPECSYSTAFSH